MHPAVNIAVLIEVIVADAIDYLSGFLRGGTVVEINQGFAVNLFLKDGKIDSYFLDVITHVAWFNRDINKTNLGIQATKLVKKGGIITNY